MRLIPKNTAFGYKFLTFPLENKSKKVITKLLPVIIYVFSFLQLFPITQTAARTPNNSNSCIQNSGLNGQISNLL